MSVYITIFFTILISFFNFRVDNQVKKLFSSLFLFVLIIFIGLRYEVGGDWFQYLAMFDQIQNNIFRTDIGYSLINLFSNSLGMGIYGVNFISALLFLYGLYTFFNTFKIKYSYGLLISFPYLIMIVSMGYTRQAIALGMLMVVYSAIYKKQVFKSVLFFILAILFHKSAILGSIVFFTNQNIPKKYLITMFLFIVSILVLLFTLLQNELLIMWRVYVLDAMKSSGGIIRVGLNILASILFFIYYSKWMKFYDDAYIWKLFAYISLVMFIVLLVTGSSTMVDRVMLYFYPLQIIVFSRVVYLIKNKQLKQIYFLALVSLYSGVLFVWLLFASHKFSWIPYRNVLEFVF